MRGLYCRFLLMAATSMIVMLTVTVALAEHDGLVEQPVFTDDTTTVVCLDNGDSCFEAISLGFEGYRSGANGRIASKIQYGTFDIRKTHDVLSPRLFEDLTRNRVLPEVVVTIYGTFGGSDDHGVLATYTLSDAVVAAIKLSGADKKPTETVSFNFSEFCIEVPSYNSSGQTTNTVETCHQVVSARR